MESVVESQAVVRDGRSIDRTKVCPILVRVFCTHGRHHIPSDYMRGKTPGNELQIYTWMDASLKELTNMVRVSNPDVRRRGTTFDFAVVYADNRSQGYQMRKIGSVTAGRAGPDDIATLANKKYQIGDLIEIAITHPLRPNMRGMRNRPY